LTRIFLIRHAEAEGNIFRRAHGHFDGQIIGRGFEQIEKLKTRFEHEKIDAVYSSDLLRTKVTASSIYEPHNLKLNTTEQLREVDMGAWEDIAWGNIEHDDPDMNRYFSMDPEKWNVPGSEDFHHLQRRIKNCLLEIAKRHDPGTVAVFSHGFAIRSFICGILGIESREISKVTYYDNTAVSLLQCENDELKIVFKGDNSHLSSKISTFANQSWWRAKSEQITENLRILPLCKERDSMLLKQISEETGKAYTANAANMAYTAFIADEQVGVVGLSNVGGSPGGAIRGQGRVCNAGLNDIGVLEDADIGDGDVGWIDYICVKQGLQRRSYGIQLLGQAVSVFRKLRRGKLRVKIPYDHPAIGFFEKYGFVKINGIDEHYVMEKNIRNWA
jgi:probable phosphoglycerate mutase